MATTAGNDGTIEVGANEVAEVLSWTLEEGITIIDDTVVGDTDDTHLTGTKNWSGTIECYWDDTDTTGQGALVNGASVTLNLLPEGNATGDYRKTGTATVSGLSTGLSNNSVNTASFNFTGNGALTIDTVPV